MSEPQVITDPNWGGSPAAAYVPPARDERGQPLAARLVTSKEEEPSGLAAMLGPLAHPETLTDFARLLTLPVDTVRKALATAVAARIGPGVAGQALSATGRGAETLADSRAGRLAEAGGVADAVYRLDPKGVAIAAAPTALRLVGRGLQRAGGALSGETNAISAAEEAALLKQGYSPQVIAKMRMATPPASATAPSPAPVAEPPTATAPAAAPVAEPPAPVSPPVAAKPFLRAAEATEYKRLLKIGKTHQEAMDLIQAQRDFAAKFGTPTSEQVRGSVTDRNASGRWPE